MCPIPGPTTRIGNTSLWGPAAVAVTGRPSAMATCLVINNTFPGPTVRATLGQLVRVDVINNIINGPVTVHWHGLSMVRGHAGSRTMLLRRL